jgi:hypothetical protein
MSSVSRQAGQASGPYPEHDDLILDVLNQLAPIDVPIILRLSSGSSAISRVLCIPRLRPQGPWAPYYVSFDFVGCPQEAISVRSY